jgi:hypothetical protein
LPLAYRPQYPMDRRLDGLHNLTGWSGKDKSPSIQSTSVTLLTDLSLLLYLLCLFFVEWIIWEVSEIAIWEQRIPMDTVLFHLSFHWWLPCSECLCLFVYNKISTGKISSTIGIKYMRFRIINLQHFTFLQHCSESAAANESWLYTVFTH